MMLWLFGIFAVLVLCFFYWLTLIGSDDIFEGPEDHRDFR